MIFQLLLQLVLKGALNDLWGLFFTLQIMCYLSIYETRIPSSAMIFIDQFKDIIKFKLLKPDPFIQMFYPEFSIKEKIMGKAKNPINRDQEFNVFEDLEVYIFILIGSLIGSIILGGIYVVFKGLRKWVREYAINKKNNFVFNGYIRSIYVSFIEMCLTVGFQV